MRPASPTGIAESPIQRRCLGAAPKEKSQVFWPAAGLGSVSTRSTILAHLLAPSAKTASFVNYWDDPEHVRQALLVGAALLAVAVVIGILGWFVKRQEEQQRQARRERSRR